MRALLALLCLFSGSPDDATESVDTVQEPKVERYRAFLAELASSGPASEPKAPIDLPKGLKEAIETWTGQ